MIVNCPGCQKDIELAQPYLFHAAFIQRGFLYCDRCSHTLTIESGDPSYSKLVRSRHPWTLSYREKRRVEAHLKPCECGGKFAFDIPPRCPRCQATWGSLVPDRLQFYEVGKVFDPSRDGLWRDIP